MLIKVDIVTPQGDLLSLPLDDISNGFVVQDIQGLDPVKATLVSSSFAGADGEQYQSSRRDKRNITMEIGLDPDHISQNVRDLRKQLYKFLMPKSQATFRFLMEDGLEVVIPGRVESLEIAMFVEEPVANASILCFDPDFIDPVPVLVPGVTTSTEERYSVNYLGTVDTGFSFKLQPTHNVDEFTIYHDTPDGTLRIMEFANVPLLTGDILEISTVFGNKYAMLTRAGVTSQVLYGLSPQSDWTELSYGTNYIRVYAEGISVPFEISFVNRYGGL